MSCPTNESTSCLHEINLISCRGQAKRGVDFKVQSVYNMIIRITVRSHNHMAESFDVWLYVCKWSGCEKYLNKKVYLTGIF